MNEETKLALVQAATELAAASINSGRFATQGGNIQKNANELFQTWLVVVQDGFNSLSSEKPAGVSHARASD